MRQGVLKIFFLQAENEPEPECEPIEDPHPELLDNQTLENKEVRKETRISTCSCKGCVLYRRSA